MQNDKNQYQEEGSLPDEPSDEIAEPELRWEKGVEFALARELQAWHVEVQLKKLTLDWKSCTPQKILELVANRSREPRYLPLAGNAEKTLGDALAASKNNRLLLLECKNDLDSLEWNREALPETRRSIEGGKVKVSNAGGKSRLVTLENLKHVTFNSLAGKTTFKELSTQCHFVIGNKESISGKTKQRKLMYAGYWNFIFMNKEGKNIDDLVNPIVDLSSQGLPISKFREYIYKLLEDDLSSSSDTSWIAREMILLAYTEGQDANVSGWIGCRILASTLSALLDFDKGYQDLISKILALEELKRKASKKAKEEQQKNEAALANLHSVHGSGEPAGAKKNKLKKNG